jgi:hypothetical protein
MFVLAAAPHLAHAGRSDFGWLDGTDVMPERGVELQTWIAEQNDVEGDGGKATWWWAAPLVGLTDRLELALPIEVLWAREQGRAFTALDRYGAELRYRFVTQDPVDAPAFVPLVRVAVYRVVTAPDTVNPEASFVGGFTHGRVHAAVELGLHAELSSNASHFVYTDEAGNVSASGHHFEFRPGAGISILAFDGVRLGAELHAEITLDQGESWVIAGPDVAWTFGRFWLSAAYGFGFGPHAGDAPRVQWGIAF